MDYLQYYEKEENDKVAEISFKPCYKWITFNTQELKWF